MARSQNVFVRSAISTLEFLVSFCLEAMAAIVPKFLAAAAAGVSYSNPYLGLSE
jgi:hypothetical protein